VVLGRMRSRTARFVGLATVLTFTAASAAFAAPGASSRVGASATAHQLGTQAHQALLSLYALDSRLHAWQARIASLERTATVLRERRASLRQELGAARASLKTGQQQLAVDLRALYERRNVDAVAVVRGAKSLTTGLGKLDALSRVTDQSNQIVAATAAARGRLLRSQGRLAAEGARLARSLAAARQAEARLVEAAAARRTYISSLQAKERMHAQQVRSVAATAKAVQQ